jgi:hypothetical protein
MEKELLKNDVISKITCATDTACNLVEKFTSKYDSIEHYRETRWKKVFNLRKIVQSADKVVLFEYTDYDGETYSLTQKALKYARELKRDLQYVGYDRGEKKGGYSMSDDNKYKVFFEEIKKFKEEQEKQKQRGLNDYNMVNVVRKETHEVGMHSNILASLLNPNGLHYQGDLFLQCFIEDVLGFKDKFFGNNIKFTPEERTIESDQVEKNKRIDFTIKSDEYYIGIEMKIDHYDSKEQIYKYYKDLNDKAENDKKQKVIMFYLTKDGKEAPKYSRCKEEDNVFTKCVDLHCISFETEILKWIDSCQKKVKNITNLNESFNNYRDVVKKITDDTYKGNIMQLKTFLDQDTNIEYLNEIFDIKNHIHKILGNRLYKLLSYLDEYITKKEIQLINNMVNDKEKYIYSEDKCSKWFYNNEKIAGLQKTECIGSFFKLNDSILLRVEASRDTINIGLVSCERKNDKYEIIKPTDTLKKLAKNNQKNLKERDWAWAHWYSIDCGNFITTDLIENMKCYKNPENCYLKNTIDMLINIVKK